MKVSKRTIPKPDKWEIDKNWFISSSRNFFNIGDVIYLVKLEETHLLICFHGNGIDLDAKSEKGRDELFQWLTAMRIKHYEATKVQEVIQHKMHRASLEIQNQMAGALINHGH